MLTPTERNPDENERHRAKAANTGDVLHKVVMGMCVLSQRPGGQEVTQTILDGYHRAYQGNRHQQLGSQPHLHKLAPGRANVSG
jgi:hypothetical protein